MTSTRTDAGRAPTWHIRALDSERGLIALSLIVGAAAGAGAIAFRYLILGATELFTGHRDYSAVGPAVNRHVPGLGIWFVVLAPVVGGLLYGPLVARFAPEARGHGVPEVMLAVSRGGGRIRPRVPAVKALASALCIGSGGSVGREGPIVQIGAATASAIGQLARLPEQRLRLLVACGAAGGISATFNAPIAGVFFALEIILRDFEARSFGVVVLSSVTADVLGRAAFGSGAFLQLPGFHVTSAAEYLLYAGLGVAAAGVGVAFVRVLYGTEDVADRIWRGPEWARPAVGGLALGALLLVIPQMYGVGYPVLENVVRGHEALWFVCVLLVAKMAATSLTISIGGSGGVFAPSLFLGGMLGSVYGRAAHLALPALTAGAGAYGLVGMGAVFAACSRAPITAVLIVFELTGDYAIILPLMVAIVLATAVANRMTEDTIYTLKLRRRGIELGHVSAGGPLDRTPVTAAMRGLPVPLERGADLDAVTDALLEAGTDAIPVVDAGHGSLVGVVSLADVERATAQGRAPTAGELARAAPVLKADASLEAAIAVLAEADDQGVPVLAAGGSEVVGWLTHRDLVEACRAALTSASEPPTPATDRRARLPS